jgi:hypothetical protein
LSSTLRSLILSYCEREQAHDEHKKAERDQAQEHALFDTCVMHQEISCWSLRREGICLLHRCATNTVC